MDESKQIMTRYLLGELSESERSALEEKYFTDPEVFNQVLKIENELVDDYARDRLSKDTRERVEKFYMAHPARTERVKFAAALTARIDQLNESEAVTLPVSWWQKLLTSLRGQRPALRFSMALATLLVVIGSIWVFVERRERQRVQTQAYEAQQQREREQSQQAAEEARRARELTAQQERIQRSPQQIPQASPTPNGSSTPYSVSLALTVASVRSGNTGQTPTLVIPPGTTQTRLLLNIRENDFPTYRASLRMVTGVEIFSQTNVKPRRGTSGANFTFTVPASKLQSGDYVLTLQGVSSNGGVEDLSKSLFRVEKK
jgi:type II secretory pathway pseudopilin PulG